MQFKSQGWELGCSSRVEALFDQLAKVYSIGENNNLAA